MTTEPRKQLASLQVIVREMESVAVAYCSGVDSTMVLSSARGVARISC